MALALLISVLICGATVVVIGKRDERRLRQAQEEERARLLKLKEDDIAVREARVLTANAILEEKAKLVDEEIRELNHHIKMHDLSELHCRLCHGAGYDVDQYGVEIPCRCVVNNILGDLDFDAA